MEMTKQYKLKDFNEVVKEVPRYKASDKAPDYNAPLAKRIISKELNNMAWEIKRSEAGSSTLVKDEHDRVTHRAFTKSSFPKYMSEAGINSTKDFLKVLSQKKGIRHDRLKNEAIKRLEQGYKNEHGFDVPSKEFLVASKQLYDNKNVIFRRVRGRIIPIRVPHDKRHDLVPF
jgi:hypothetical protein